MPFFYQKIRMHKFSKLPVSLEHTITTGYYGFKSVLYDEMPSPWQLYNAPLQRGTVNTQYFTDCWQKWYVCQMEKVTQTIQYFVTINQELPSQYVFNNIFFKHNMEYPCAFINSTSAINSSEIFHYPESNSQLIQKSLFMSAFFHLTHSFPIE